MSFPFPPFFPKAARSPLRAAFEPGAPEGGAFFRAFLCPPPSPVIRAPPRIPMSGCLLALIVVASCPHLMFLTNPFFSSRIYIYISVFVFFCRLFKTYFQKCSLYRFFRAICGLCQWTSAGMSPPLMRFCQCVSITRFSNSHNYRSRSRSATALPLSISLGLQGRAELLRRFFVGGGIFCNFSLFSPTVESFFFPLERSLTLVAPSARYSFPVEAATPPPLFFFSCLCPPLLSLPPRRCAVRLTRQSSFSLASSDGLPRVRSQCLRVQWTWFLG